MPHEPETTTSTERSDASSRILIAVCTLNEAANVSRLVSQLRNAIPSANIVVLDDDSPDGTAKLVSQLASEDSAIDLIVRKDQRGLGSAIRNVMQVAVDDGYEYFINLDGDLSHDPLQLPALLERMLQTPELDVVIGSRYVAGGSIVGWPLHRKLMSRLVNRFATVCLGLPVKDCSGSMRCYRVAALVKLGLENLHQDGYAVLEEVLMKLHRQGAQMDEVPITFTDRTEGKSKLTLREAVRSTFQILTMAKR
ncbi:MAG: polyprenol monophosphomannose synthase [Rubripirellula sp.]